MKLEYYLKNQGLVGSSFCCCLLFNPFFDLNSQPSNYNIINFTGF